MNNLENLKNECRTIEDNARHTAEAHHILASRSSTLAFWFEIIPAVAASLSGLLVVGEVIPAWWGWITVVSAVITATSSIVGPHKTYYENLNAAKSFTVIKHKARSLHSSFASTYNEQDYIKEVKSLSDYYNQLILLTPPTQEWAYKKAVKKLCKPETKN
jgi:hypothetical protein